MGTSEKPKPAALGVTAKAGVAEHARNPNMPSFTLEAPLGERERDGLPKGEEADGVREATDENRGLSTNL